MAVTISAVERLAACGVAPGKIAWKNKQAGRERYQHLGITTGSRQWFMLFGTDDKCTVNKITLVFNCWKGI